MPVGVVDIRSEQARFVEERSKMADSKKESFRKYLETAGVVDTLTKGANEDKCI